MCISKTIFRTIFVGMLVIASIESTLADATVFVSPATKNVLPTGGNFVLSVNIANAVDVHAFHVVFSLNNAVIQYIGRLEGTFLNGGGAFTTFFSSNPPASPTVTSVTVDCAILGPYVASGDGTLFSITFAPVANGMSVVTLSEVELRDGNNATLPVTFQSGSVTVTNPPQTFVDPTYNSGNAGGHEFGFDAFNTLASGVNAVSTSGTVIIAPAVYNETVTLSRNVTLTPASGTPALQNLTLNTASASLGGNLQVNGTLTLTSGMLSAGTNRVIITSSEPGAVVITSGSINGEIQRAIAALSTGSYMFTDLNTQLIPDGLQGAITASIRSFPNTTPPNIGTGAAINRYYSIAPSGSLTATVRLAYLDGEINGISETSMDLFRYSGVAWVPVLPSFPNPVGNYVETPDVSQFSDWTIGDQTEVTNSYGVAAGWNMISLPMTVSDGRKTVQFPTATSSAFGFDNSVGYVQRDTLRNLEGYWLKFDSAQNIPITGIPISQDTIDVRAGWSLIGSITNPVDVVNVVQIPPGILQSPFFEYSGSYNVADVLAPAKAYWVRSSAVGHLVLSSSVGRPSEVPKRTSLPRFK